jgi:hypothetical protein
VKGEFDMRRSPTSGGERQTYCRETVMRSKFEAILVLVMTCCLLTEGETARAQFEQLVTKVPESANSIVLVNMGKVMSSPAAVKGKWKDEHSASYKAGITFLPPHSVAAVLSANIDVEKVRPLWSVAVLALENEASIPAIEALTGGKVEPLGTYSAIALEGSGYLVQFAPKLLAAIAPASRQDAGRWVREVADATQVQLSPYLNEAYGFANQVGTPLVMALDLQDVSTPAKIREVLGASEQYGKMDPGQLESLSSWLASIRGITLGITLESEVPYGKVKVDFGQPPGLNPDQAKALLLHALAEHGAMLDDLHEWTPKVNQSAITLEGYLSPSGMRRLTSLFDRPPAFKPGVEFAAAAANAPAAPTQQSTQQLTDGVSVQASQEYFRRVTDLVNDLRAKPRGATNYTMGSIAKWYDTFARKIDQLPSAGVDPELSNYGAYAADSLRAASSSIHTSYARKRARQVSTPVPYDYYTYNNTYGFAYRWNLWGGFYVPWGSWETVKVPDYRAYQQDRTAISAQERVTGANQAREIVGKLDEATGDIRRRMAAKYKTNF